MSRLPCPPALWARFSELLDTALDQPASERDDWLAGLAGEDASLKPWLARVLASDAGMETDYLREQARVGPQRLFQAGMAIGPYRLESLLGEGGMGEVWRATRGDDGPRREVALKLPHPELLGGPYRLRFARERDMLAALSHAHIAQLYDAGVSAEGYPYLAIELVDGRPITEACAAARASLERRVDLVRQILGALTYAHQRLIVHRDIKPTNVLVTPDGAVKLLDFGIAKLLHPTNAEDGHLTRGLAELATPAYAAPEQFVDGEITVASDIFSAGVLLFELCTGQRPFLAPRRGPQTQDAPLASQRADAQAAGLGGVDLARALRGDLDAVIARALAVDPAARYSSAEAFGRDLARWRNGLPVSARRVGWATLSLKFARRNKVGVALAGVLALALAGGTAGIAWQAHVASLEAARAEREAARATAVKDYMIGLFEEADPHSGAKPSATMTVKELLDRGTDRIGKALAGQPDTEIEMLETLSRIYESIEDSSRTLQIEERRAALARALYGDDDPRTVDAVLDLAGGEFWYLDSQAAEATLQGVRHTVFTQYGSESRQRARWLMQSAQYLETVHGGRDEALEDARRAAAIFEKHFPTDDIYADALFILGDLQFIAEDYEASLATLQQREAMLSAQNSTDPVHKLEYMSGKANLLRVLGRYAEAESTALQTMDLAERTVGRQSSYYLAGLRNMAVILNERGNRDQALALFAKGMALATATGKSTGKVTALHGAYGRVLELDGDAMAAIPLLEATLQEAKANQRDESEPRIFEYQLGDAYDQVGRTEEARKLLRASRDEWVKYGVPAGIYTLGPRERWARFLLEHGEPDAARAECEDILRVAAGVPMAQSLAARAQADLARLTLLRGEAEAAERFSAQALRTLDAMKLGYDVRVRTDIWLTHAEILLANGKKQEAAGFAVRALAAARASDAPSSGRLSKAMSLVAATK